MSLFKREKEREERRESEEELPSPRGVMAFQIIIDDVRKLLDEFYTSPRKPVDQWGREPAEPALAKGIDEARIHVSTRLRMIPQSTLTIVNKKTLKNSITLLILSCLTIIESRILSARSEIESIVEALRSGEVSRDQANQLIQRLKELGLIILGSLYSLPIIIKDIDGLINLNIPFHLSSDLIRKHIGYSAAS